VLGHEPLVAPYIHVEELDIAPGLLLDRFCNSPAGMDAEPFKLPEQGPERTGFSTVALNECINHRMMRMGIGQVQVKWRIIIMVPVLYAAIPVPEIHTVTPG
jgi:hypothetical protein